MRLTIRRRTTPLRSLAVAAVVAILVGCGSSDDADTASPPAGSDAPDGESTQGDDAVPVAGPGTGTLTMADGTVYSLTMTTCETSENGAEGFILPESYDLFGDTSDGAFRVQLIRAGLDEDFISEAATLEGGFDENGANPTVLHTKVLDTLALTVDGGNVSGTVTLKSITPDVPHGDEMDATVDVSC